MNRLFRLWYFPLVPQLAMLVTFLLLVVGGLAADAQDAGMINVVRNTNLANLIVWSYWWPLIMLSAVLLGRAWCMVCPMELITSQASRIGLKRQPPAWLRSGWVMTAFYMLALFIGVHTLAIHRVPSRMAIYLLILLAAAAAIGLVFSRNTFCAYVCPVGFQLGLYARLARWGWGVRDKAVCQGCKDRSCIAEATAYRFQGRSCGVGLVPANLDDNTSCLLCGQCVKACDEQSGGVPGRPNPGWFAKPWFKELLALKPLTAAQAAFCLVVSGFVIYEIYTEWKSSKELLLAIPNWLIAQIGAESVWSQGAINSLTMFVMLPAIIWLIPYAGFRLSGGKLSIGTYLSTFAIALIPIMAAAHMTKALIKMATRIPYWEFAVNDPVGMESARAILEKRVTASPVPGWIDPTFTTAAIALTVSAIVLSAMVVRRLIKAHASESGTRGAVFYLIPATYGGIFLVQICLWRLG